MIFSNIAYLAADYSVKRGYIATLDGIVTYIGGKPPDDLATANKSLYGEVIDGTNRILLPGLVNSHCHVPMTLLRGWGEGLPLDRWLNERVFPFEQHLTPEAEYWGSLVGIAEMLASGVTQFWDMYDFCESICNAAETAGIRIHPSRALISFDGSPLKGSKRFEEAERLMNRRGDLITPEVSIHAEYTSHESYVREAAEFAKSFGAAVHIHLSETAKEHNECIARHGVTPAAYFERTGLFDSPTTAAHCVHVTTADIEILKAHGVTAVNNPTSNLKLNSGIAPVKTLIDSGVNVALGTDGAASNNNLNMFEEMHLSALLNRLSPAEALKIATRNGKLSVGGNADFAVLNLDKPHLRPSHDLLANIVFSAQASDIEMTVVAGKIVYRDGKTLGFDVQEAMSNAEREAYRIAKLVENQ
jgi:5-methylthioadenosine/S-adenosylhomocysteine deaminase